MSHKGWEIKHWAPEINPPFKTLIYHNPLHPQPLRAPCFYECRGCEQGCPQAGSRGQDAAAPLCAALTHRQSSPCVLPRWFPAGAWGRFPAHRKIPLQPHTAFDSLEGGWALGRCLPPPSCSHASHWAAYGCPQTVLLVGRICRWSQA